MPFTNGFIISARFMSLAIILLMATTLNVNAFSYKAVFIGLLFSHFFMGFYYSRANLKTISQNKTGLAIATGIMGVGIWLAFTNPTLSKYFLVFHSALSDAYLLSLRSRSTDHENLALTRTIFYSICFGLLIVEMPWMVDTVLLGLAIMALGYIIYQVKERSALSLFEAPLMAIVLYSWFEQITFPFHFLGFYHILTWYVFSFWMLAVKEKDYKKTTIFFSKIGLQSVIFVVLFTTLLGYDITDSSFLKVVGAFSILHIFSTIPLSKFNPKAIKKIFYPATA